MILPIFLSDRPTLVPTHRGTIRGHDYVHQHDPDHLGRILAERLRRANNERRAA